MLAASLGAVIVAVFVVLRVVLVVLCVEFEVVVVVVAEVVELPESCRASQIAAWPKYSRKDNCALN